MTRDDGRHASSEDEDGARTLGGLVVALLASLVLWAAFFGFVFWWWGWSCF